MLDGSGSPRRCWSLSVVTLMDSEQAAASSVPTMLDSEPDVRPHKDFGVLAVPAWLRYDPVRQPDPGRWTQIGLSLSCTFGEHGLIDMMSWSC